MSAETQQKLIQAGQSIEGWRDSRHRKVGFPQFYFFPKSAF